MSDDEIPPEIVNDLEAMREFVREKMRALREAEEWNRLNVCIRPNRGGGRGGRGGRRDQDEDLPPHRRRRRRRTVDPVDPNPNHWDLTSTNLAGGVDNDPRAWVNCQDGIEYYAWQEAPEEFVAIHGKTLSSLFHPWTPKLARFATYLIRKIFHDLPKSTYTSPQGDIMQSELSVQIPGTPHAPRYLAPIMDKKPSAISEVVKLLYIFGYCQETKSPEIVASAILDTIFFGKPVIIGVPVSNGKSTFTSMFRKEVSKFVELIEALRLQFAEDTDTHIDNEEMKYFSPPVYAISDDVWPQFAASTEMDIHVKTDDTNDSFIPARIWKSVDVCAPIWIVCMSSENLGKMCHPERLDTSLYTRQRQRMTHRTAGASGTTTLPFSFTEMFGGCSDEDSIVRGVHTPFGGLVDVSMYPAFAHDQSAPFDTGENRPTGATSLIIDEVETTLKQRRDTPLGSHFSSIVGVSATLGAELVPKPNDNRLIKVHKVESSLHYIGFPISNNPFRINSEEILHVNVNGINGRYNFLPARRDGGSQKLNLTQTILKLQTIKWRDGAWNMDVFPLRPNGSGVIRPSDCLDMYSGNDEAQQFIVDLVEEARTTHFYAEKTASMLELYRRIADNDDANSTRPRLEHRSMLVVTPTTKQIKGQMMNIVSTISVLYKKGVEGRATAIVFAALAATHGNAFIIVEKCERRNKSTGITTTTYGDISPVKFVECVRDSLGFSTFNGISKNFNASGDATLRRRHAHDTSVTVASIQGLPVTVHRHSIEFDDESGTNEVKVKLLYVFNSGPNRSTGGTDLDVVSRTFNIIDPLARASRSGTLLRPGSPANNIPTLVVMGGELFGRGVRCKDSKHLYPLTDMYFSFDVSDRKQFTMTAEAGIQTSGRVLLTAMRELYLLMRDDESNRPNFHADKANVEYLDFLMSANTQLAYIYTLDYERPNGQVARNATEHMINVLNDPPPGVDFTELEELMCGHLGRTGGRSPRDVMARLTKLGLEEDEVKAYLREQLGIPDHVIPAQHLPGLAEQHTAPLDPYLMTEFNVATSAMHASFSPIMKVANNLAELLNHPVQFRMFLNNRVEVTGKRYIRALLRAILGGRLNDKSPDEQEDLPQNGGRTCYIPRPGLYPRVASLTTEERIAINFGTPVQPQGNDNNQAAAGWIALQDYMFSQNSLDLFA